MNQKLVFKITSLTKNYSNEDVINLIKKDRIKKFFCWHNWVYYHYKPATKIHRICSKCYKKQTHLSVISRNHTKIYINEIPCPKN